MKKFIAILLTLLMAVSLAACAGSNESSGNGGNTNVPQNAADNSQTEDKSEKSSQTENKSEQIGKVPDSKSDNSVSDSEGSKILVAYFSVTNNTEGVAKKLADGLGADLYEITPKQPYTDEDLNYNDSRSRSTVEMNDADARPAISGSVEHMEQYDVVFIGYPIWWGEAPRIMSTFIESYDFTGKTLVAFCTSASSGFGNSDAALKSTTDKATWLSGHRFAAGASAKDILAWANGLEIN